MQNGYPPAIIRITNRAEYILALEKAQEQSGLNDFFLVIAKAVLESIDSYLVMLDEKII